MRESQRGICWDLDHTLVGVSPELGRANELVVRPGIAATLERLARRGYRHVVTTGGTRDYAESMLAVAGLRQHFTGIFEGAEIDAGAGKRYRPVAHSLGLTNEEARARLVAIGDLVYDQPADIDGMVFIHQPNGYRCEASVVEDVIRWLEVAGAGDLLAGFHACLARMRHDTPLAQDDAAMPLLPPGLTMRLELRSPHQPRPQPRLADILIPTVRLLPSAADGVP